VYDQQISAGFADDVLDARFQPLEHPEQSEGHADLQKDQDGASRISPDAGPYEGQKLHTRQSWHRSGLIGSLNIRRETATWLECGNLLTNQRIMSSTGHRGHPAGVAILRPVWR
jgi:hypothetical protein